MQDPDRQRRGVTHSFAAKRPLTAAHIAGYDQPVEAVVEDLLGTLDDPALPLLQWTDALSAVAARLAPDLADHLQARPRPTGLRESGQLEIINWLRKSGQITCY